MAPKLSKLSKLARSSAIKETFWDKYRISQAPTQAGVLDDTLAETFGDTVLDSGVSEAHPDEQGNKYTSGTDEGEDSTRMWKRAKSSCGGENDTSPAMSVKAKDEGNTDEEGKDEGNDEGNKDDAPKATTAKVKDDGEGEETLPTTAKAKDDSEGEDPLPKTKKAKGAAPTAKTEKAKAAGPKAKPVKAKGEELKAKPVKAKKAKAKDEGADDGKDEVASSPPAKTATEEEQEAQAFATLAGDIGKCEMPGLVVSQAADTPVCCKCRCPVDTLRCYGKSPGTWKCRMCNSKAVALTRRFGSWPLPGFNDLSEADKVEFWRNAKGCPDGADLEKLVEKTITISRVNHRSTDFKGEWLPLAVWQSRGWDPEVIKQTATSLNSKADPRWGMVYKVVIESDSSGARKEQTQRDTAFAKHNAASATATGKSPEPTSQSGGTGKGGQASALKEEETAEDKKEPGEEEKEEEEEDEESGTATDSDDSTSDSDESSSTSGRAAKKKEEEQQEGEEGEEGQ